MSPQDEDPWGSAADRVLARESRETRQALSDPLAPDPEEAGNIRRLSEQSGLSVAEISLDPAVGERAAAARLADEALHDAPRLRGWLGDPSNGDVARDDIENLSVFERVQASRLHEGESRLFSDIISFFGSPAARRPSVMREQLRRGGSVGAQYEEGQRDIEYGRLAFRAHQAHLGVGEALSDEDRARLDALASREGQEDWGPFVIGPTARLLPQVVGALERGGEQAGARAGETWENPFPGFSIVPSGGPNGGGFRIEVSPSERSTARRALEGIASAPLITAASGVSGFGGAVGGYLSFGNEQETGVAFDQMLRAGVDPDIAAERATEYGAWATGIEFVGEALGLKISGVGRLATRGFLQGRLLEGGLRASAARGAGAVLGTAADQGAEEAAQELAQIIHQDLALQETQGGEADVGAAWRAALTPEAIQQILMAGYIGAQAGAGMASVPAGANFALDLRAAQRAERAAGVFEEQVRAAQSSRLNERGLASTLESAIGAMDESNVYIDADRFVEHFQSAGANAYAIADELGVGAETLATAVASHGQVEIPTARLAARVFRIPQHASLSEHVRIAPDADTPAEAKLAGARIQAEIERMVEETSALQSDNEVGAIVEQRMRDLFASAAQEGGPRPEVAARYARLVAALPRAVLARARQADPEYAAKLEAQFRKLFGEGLDVAGPGRGVVEASGAELRQRGQGPDAGPTRSDTWSPPEGVRISERQRKIAEMAINGASNEWIAEEMSDGDKLVSPQNVMTSLSQVKRKLGGAAPWERARRGVPLGINPRTGKATPTDAEVAALYEKLLASGYSNATGGAAHGGESINQIIAKRFGMTANAVAVRLTRIKKARRAVAPTKRRSTIYDLATAEARREWFDEDGNVISEPIPGETADSRQYGFALDNGEIVTVEIAVEPGGAATASWTFLGRTIQGAEPYAKGGESFTYRQLGQLLSRVFAILEADAREFERDAYVYTPATEAHGRAYKAILGRMMEGGQWPYAPKEVDGDVYLVHTDARVTKDGVVTPRPDNAGRIVPEGEELEQDQIQAIQDAFQERLVNELGQRRPIEADGGTERSGGSADGAGASADGRGGVPGDRGPGDGELEQRGWLAAIRDPQTGDIYTGSNHAEALDAAPEARWDALAEEESAHGFLGRDGRFLSREEALNEMSAALAQGEARGSIRYDGFKAGEFGNAVIKLGESANLSTFLHESGHLFHLVLESIATDPQAPAEFKAMWGSTLSWWGLDQAQWDALSPEQKVPHFEQFARTFEAYLMEGKAPSLSLREAFAAFKAWLTQIYRSALRLDANLKPEIRDVFDRLLATDAEIAEARAEMGSDFALPREAFKTDEEYQSALQVQADAREAQEGELRARAMDAFARKSKRWWRGERERMRPAAIRAVDSHPARRAHDWLATQDWRALPDTELSEEGEIGYVAPESAMEAMPEGLPAMSLDGASLQADWPAAQLPVGLNPRMNPETVLAEAMRIKGAGKGRGNRAQRLATFIRAQGGIKDADGRLRAAMGSGRKRPGLINNETGKTPEEMMRLAVEAGYFGEGAAREISAASTAPPFSQRRFLEEQLAHHQRGLADAQERADQFYIDHHTKLIASIEAQLVSRELRQDGPDAGQPSTSQVLSVGDANGGNFTPLPASPLPDGSASEEGSVHPGFELFHESDKAPSLEEFMATLIADLTNERQVYSARDAGALGANQDLSDAQAWFDAHGIDLSQDKESIRAQIVAALEKDRADPNAVSPDDAAPWFGFSSGDELIQALAALKPRAQAIEDEINRLVEEEYGDAGSREKIEASARLAAHAEVQAKRIEVELAALQKAVGGRVRPVSAAARRFAEDQIDTMTLREIRNADVFLAGERRAARAAFEAAKKGDWPEAARAKQRQLLSFWLYKTARAAAENADRMQARWKRYSAGATTRAAIGPRHIEQIDAILDSIETGRPQFKPSQSLTEWAEMLAEEDNADLIVFNPEAVQQQIKRPLAQMEWGEVQALDDVLRNIETIGRGMIRLRNAKEAQRIADIQAELKERIAVEWKDKLARKLSLVAPNAAEKGALELRHIHAQLLKMDYLARLLDGLKDGGPWMRMMAQAQDAENDLQARSQAATQQFLALTRAHYTPAQFRDLLSKRIYIEAIGDNRTKAQIISAALNVGNEYNRDALMRGEGWDERKLSAVLGHLDDNDWTFVQALWNYVGQWKEESFALDERTRGSRPPEVIAAPFTLPSGRTLSGGYWPVAFDTERSDVAAQREAQSTIIGEYGGAFRQAATNRGRLKGRVGTKGQALSSDFMAVLARHVHDSLRDITHRELVITMRKVKADRELRNMIARVAGRDAVRALDEWTHRIAARTPASVFGDYGRLPAYLRRAATSHAMGFKVSVATLNLLGHLQAIPRNGVIAQMKQAGLSVAVGLPDLLRRHAMAIATGEKEVSSRLALVYEKSEMMRNRRNTFDRDINEVKGDIVGRREGSVLPKQLEDTLQILNAYTDQVVAVPTWLAAYESAKNGKVDGVSGEEASVTYADSVVRMTISAGATKDLAAMIASNNQWQRLVTMFMGWASGYYNQLFTEQFPGVASGKISLARFTANMIWIWLLPSVITAIFYGQAEKRDDEDEWQFWARMSLSGLTYPLQTIPVVRDLMSTLVLGYRPQNPLTATIDRAGKFALALERQDERQMVKQGYLLAGQLTGVPAQAYVTGDYMSDLIRGEEEPLEDPVDAVEEALLRDTR